MQTAFSHNGTFFFLVNQTCNNNKSFFPLYVNPLWWCNSREAAVPVLQDESVIIPVTWDPHPIVSPLPYRLDKHCPCTNQQRRVDVLVCRWFYAFYFHRWKHSCFPHPFIFTQGFVGRKHQFCKNPKIECYMAVITFSSPLWWISTWCWFSVLWSVHYVTQTQCCVGMKLFKILDMTLNKHRMVTA